MTTPKLPVVAWMTADNRLMHDRDKQMQPSTSRVVFTEPLCKLSDAIEAATEQPEEGKLLQIIAAMYQIAGVYDAPEHVLDVLANPEMATQEQIDTLLPFSITQSEKSPPAQKDTEIAQLQRVLTSALTRMDRARGWLTNDNPRPACNWGVLDTEDLRKALVNPIL